jgi:hypothetical protein
MGKDAFTALQLKVDVPGPNLLETDYIFIDGEFVCA